MDPGRKGVVSMPKTKRIKVWDESERLANEWVKVYAEWREVLGLTPADSWTIEESINVNAITELKRAITEMKATISHRQARHSAAV